MRRLVVLGVLLLGLVAAPAADAALGSVFDDLNNNGLRENGEPTVPDAEIRVYDGADQQVGPVYEPNEQGQFNVPEPNPNNSEEGKIIVSRPGYTSVERTFNQADPNFGAIGLYAPNGLLTGNVYIETNGQPGLQAADAPAQFAFVTVTTTVGGTPFARTVRATTEGEFTLPVPAGPTLTVTAPPPGGLEDGLTQAPMDLPGAMVNGGTVSNFSVANGATVGPFDFGKVGASISGRLFSDRDDDDVFDAGERPLAGAQVTANGSNYTDTTTTNASGEYTFVGIPAGQVTITPPDFPTASAQQPAVRTAQGSAIGGVDFAYDFPMLQGTLINEFTGGPIPNVTVTMDDQSQPTDDLGQFLFFDVPDDATLAVVAPAGYVAAQSVAGNNGGTVGAGFIVDIPVEARADSLFDYQLRLRRAELRGTVCVDVDRSGACDPAEPTLPDVDVTTSQPNDDPTTVKTGADGRYLVGDLLNGIGIVSASAPGYGALASLRTFNVPSPAAQLTQDLPVSGAEIAGTVTDDFGHPVEGVEIVLGGTATATELTAADGTYRFRGLKAGTYSLTQTQPAAFGDGSAEPGEGGGGTADGANAIVGIQPAAAADLEGYDFVERSASLDVLVVAGPDDRGVPGVAGAVDDGTYKTLRTTNGVGRFTVEGLRPGDRKVTITPPAGYTGETEQTVAVKAGEPNPVTFKLTPPPADPTPTPAVTPTPPPTSTPSPTPSPTSSPVISRQAFVVVGKRVRVRDKRLSIGCGVDRGAVRRCVLRVRRGKRVLARGRTDGDGFRTVTTGLKLTKAGRRALRRGGRLRATIAISVTPETGATLTARRGVKILGRRR